MSIASQNPTPPFQKHIVVTGGAGFVGSHFVRLAIEKGFHVTVFDSLTYSGSISNLPKSDFLRFIHGSILANQDIAKLVNFFLKDKLHLLGIFHFAAETHVDASISSPKEFVETNVIGTCNLLEFIRHNLKALLANSDDKFRFLHVSTDEVFGELGHEGKFSENSSYAPSSPYSASKAASDHLTRAWCRTYGLPAIVTNCSNNYGPRQYPEKLIPFMIFRALNSLPLSVYGNGNNIRDWIHVEDHCQGILQAFEKGNIQESYCFGGDTEKTNLEVVKSICHSLDRQRPLMAGEKYESQIKFVPNRLGHDFRYAIDSTKAKSALGFKTIHSNFDKALDQTVGWYLNNQSWVREIMEKGKKQ